MRKTIFLLVLPVLFITGCNNPESTIKKDLDSRFTKFEVAEIKKDSSNIYNAMMSLNSLKIEIATANADMARMEGLYWDKKVSRDKLGQYMDSVTTKLGKSCMTFMHLMGSRTESCYRVKYRLSKEELKIEKEEYYYLKTYDEGKKIEALHRPCDWDQFLKEEGHSDLIGECSKYYLEFLRNEIQQ